MNASFVYAIAALAAAATLYGAIRLFGGRASDTDRESGAQKALVVVGTARAEQDAKDSEESELEVLSRTPVGFGGSLVLVRFEGRRMLLGVTRGQWTALADLGRAPSHAQQSLASIDAELNRALQADRFRRGRKGS